MSNATVFDELDQAVTAMIGNPEGDVASYVSTHDQREDIRELLHLAAQLRYAARPAFRAQLKADLLDEAFVAGDNRGDVASYVSTNRNGNGVGVRTIRVPYQDKVLPSL